MSNGNIVPIRQQAAPQQAAAPSQQDWWGPPWATNPIWPPPPPWWGQGCPPPPGCSPCLPQPCPPPACAPCPTPPSCFSQVAKAQACYDQSQALYNLVTQVVMDIFAKNPGIIPVPPPGSAGAGGPIQGVTDGSFAKAGFVGEIISATKTIPFTGGTSTPQVTVITPLIVQPGDWDFWASMDSGSVTVSSLNFYLNPIPVGFVGDLDAGDSSQAEGVLINAQGAGSFSAPTALAFTCTIASNTGLPAGTSNFAVFGRRRR